MDNSGINPGLLGTSVYPGLVDQFGNPLRPQERGEELLGHYEGYARFAIAVPGYNPDVFINSKGWQTLTDMLSLGAVRTPLNIVRDSILCKGWTVQPAVTDQMSADFAAAEELAHALRYALENITDEYDNIADFRQVLWELAYAIHTGFRITEMHWRTIERGDHAGKWGFASFSAKPCKQIGFDVDPDTMQPRGVTAYVPNLGYRYAPIEKVLRYTFNPTDGLPHGQGTGRAAYKHSWSLDFLYRFWNICLEVFGAPFILGKAEDGKINLARKVLKEIRQGAPAVLPSGVEAELVELTGGGPAAFKLAADHHIQEIGKLYTYAALTSGEGQRVGSMALGNVHQDTQGYGVGGRRADLEQVVNNQLVRRWVRYNYGEDALRLAPRVHLGESDESDLEALANAFTQLVNADILHPMEPQIRERMGLAPIDPESLELMKRVWENPETGPSTIPTTTDDNEE